jgi:hypothetical protein
VAPRIYKTESMPTPNFSLQEGMRVVNDGKCAYSELL